MKGAAIKQHVVVTMARSMGMIEKQIELLERTKSVLVSCWGQVEYDNRISELMTKMLDDHKISGEDLMGADDSMVGKDGDSNNKSY